MIPSVHGQKLQQRAPQHSIGALKNGLRAKVWSFQDNAMASSWSERCTSARETPLPTLLNRTYAICGVTVSTLHPERECTRIYRDV